MLNIIVSINNNYYQLQTAIEILNHQTIIINLKKLEIYNNLLLLENNNNDNNNNNI